MSEIWKQVPGYSRYEVKKGYPGSVKSLNYRNTGKEHIMSLQLEKHGHYRVWLYGDDGKRKYIRVHTLIYLAFVGDIPEGMVVHHKDHKPSHNIPKNLELVTPNEHAKEHPETIRAARKKSLIVCSKPVLQFDKNGNLIKEFPSLQEAARQTGCGQGNISVVCNNGRLKTAGGFIWKFK